MLITGRRPFSWQKRTFDGGRGGLQLTHCGPQPNFSFEVEADFNAGQGTPEPDPFRTFGERVTQ
jgi:hypothetical protein